MANEIIGAKSYLVMQTETSWGEIVEGSGTGGGSGSTGWVHVPVSSYTVRQRPQRRSANVYIGLKQRKHGTMFRGMPSGQIALPFYGFKPAGLGVSLAEWLMDWAFESHELVDLPSKSAVWAEGPNVANKRHLGLRVNTATLAGDANSGLVNFTFDVMGRTEEGNTAVGTAMQLPDDREKLLDANFSDCTFALGGSAIELSAFSLQVQYGLIAHFNNVRQPSLLVSPTRQVLVNMTIPPKNSDTWDTVRRVLNTGSEYVGQIVVQGLHNGTGPSGNYTICTIDLPRLQYIDHEDQMAFEQLTLQPLQFEALKPDASSNDLTISWSNG